MYLLLTVQDDYRLIFYISDIPLIVAIIVIYFKFPDRVKDSKNQEPLDSFFTVMKKLASPATNILFCQCIAMGIVLGIYQNQGILYLTDELGATPAMVSNSIAVSMGTGIILAPIQTHVIKFFGVANILLLALLLNSSRLFCYAFFM